MSTKNVYLWSILGAVALAGTVFALMNFWAAVDRGYDSSLGKWSLTLLGLCFGTPLFFGLAIRAWSPVQGASTSATPQSAKKPYRCALLSAFAACFLWMPLMFICQKILGLPNDGPTLLSLWAFVILIVFVILYPSGWFQEKRRAARVCWVLLTSVALFLCASFLSFVLIILLGRFPFPM